jgi:predicted Zn finger-like uncharacterized protein
MKFLCDRCKTRYAIADDRVRGKILKIRCKNCSAVITVREGMDDGSAEPTRSPAPTMPAPPAMPAAAPPAALDDEWYVSKDGNQEGPFTLTEAQAWVAARASDDDLHCWNEGFDDWLPIEKVSHFRGLRGAPRTRAQTRPPTVPEPEPQPLFAATLAAMEAEAAAEAAADAPPPSVPTSAAAAMAQLPPPRTPAPSAWRVPTPAVGVPGAVAAAAAGHPRNRRPGAPRWRTGVAQAQDAGVGVPALPSSGRRRSACPRRRREPPPKPAEAGAASALPRPFGSGSVGVDPVRSPRSRQRPAAGAAAMFAQPRRHRRRRAARRRCPRRRSRAAADVARRPQRARLRRAPPRFDHGEPDLAPEADLVDDDAPAGVTPPPDDDLDIGEVSRVVRLADLMGPPAAAAAAPRPAGKPRAQTAAEPVIGRATAGVPAIGRGTAAMPAVGRATGTNEAIFAASQTAAAGLGMSDPAMAPPPVARRRGAALYVGIGFVAIALIVVAAIVMSSGGEDAGGNDTAGGSDDFSKLGYRPTDPLRPGGGTQDVGPGPGTGKGPGTGRRPNSNGGGTGTGSAPRAVVDAGVPTNPALRELSPDDVFTMSARMETGTRRCYERAMKADPFLKVSKIKATITVSAAGPVTGVRLSDKADHPLGQCLIAALERWPFPASREGIVSEFALVFEQK